jgi:hypothetical protein
VVFVGTVAIGLTLFEMTEELEARNIDGEYRIELKGESMRRRATKLTVAGTSD